MAYPVDLSSVDGDLWWICLWFAPWILSTKSVRVLSIKSVEAVVVLRIGLIRLILTSSRTGFYSSCIGSYLSSFLWFVRYFRLSADRLFCRCVVKVWLLSRLTNSGVLSDLRLSPFWISCWMGIGSGRVLISVCGSFFYFCAEPGLCLSFRCFSRGSDN